MNAIKTPTRPDLHALPNQRAPPRGTALKLHHPSTLGALKTPTRPDLDACLINALRRAQPRSSSIIPARSRFYLQMARRWRGARSVAVLRAQRSVKGRRLLLSSLNGFAALIAPCFCLPLLNRRGTLRLRRVPHAARPEGHVVKWKHWKGLEGSRRSSNAARMSVRPTPPSASSSTARGRRSAVPSVLRDVPQPGEVLIIVGWSALFLLSKRVPVQVRLAFLLGACSQLPPSL